MNFGQLESELLSRGADYVADNDPLGVRLKRWVNQAYLELCESWSWPFLEIDATGPAPLTIADMRAVLYVLSPTNQTKLTWVDQRDLTNWTADTSLPGTPSSYWLAGQTVNVYPASTQTIAVRYLKVPAELVNTADEPVVPQRFHDLIVDGAMIRIYKDSDNYEALAQARQEHDRATLAMAASLMVRNHSEPDQITVTSGGW